MVRAHSSFVTLPLVINLKDHCHTPICLCHNILTWSKFSMILAILCVDIVRLCDVTCFTFSDMEEIERNDNFFNCLLFKNKIKIV